METNKNQEDNSFNSDKKSKNNVQPKLNEIDEEKVKNISKKIKEINNKFECLIGECRIALNKLN